MNRFFGAWKGLLDLQSLGTPAPSRVIRHCQIKIEEPEDRAYQAFKLTQGQPTHCPQRQRRLDRQSRIVGLTTAGCAGLGQSGGDGFRREPHGQTASLTQAGIVLGPVRHPVPLLGNVMTACGIGLKWHGRCPIGGAVLQCCPVPVANSPIPATTRVCITCGRNESLCYRVWHLIDGLALVASDLPQHGLDVLLYRNGATVHLISDVVALLSCEE